MNERKRESTDYTVRTAEGSVRGSRSGDLLRWVSIPYAAPPVGPLRFRAPQPVQPWDEIRDATHFGYASPQPKFGRGLGPNRYQPISEDCLTLNVTAPATPSTKPRPVMVWIHGGGNVIGTSALALYSGSTLVPRGDLVLVAINYRLGTLGWVDFSRYSTPERTFDTNLGLRDQIAALQWVQRNIAAFGGDPDNVTIFGESAGASGVTTLLCTPASAGLFHRAIAESSPVDWALHRDDAATLAGEVVESLGATEDSAVRALETATPREFGTAMGDVMIRHVFDSPGWFLTVPVIDGDVLPKPQLTAFADGSAHRVPLIIGTNRHEATIFQGNFAVLPTDSERIHTLFTKTDPDAESRVLAAYPDLASKRARYLLAGDFTFLRPTIAAADAHSAYAPTYVYRYDYAPPIFKRAGLGATHASEMLAVFGFAESRFGRLLAVGGLHGMRQVTKQMQSHWLAFARGGKPFGSWPQYEPDQRPTMIFDAPKARVELDPNALRRKAWAGYAGWAVRFSDVAAS